MGSREELHAAAQIHSLVKSLFQAIDTDGNGEISAREVRDFFRTRATGISSDLSELISTRLEARESSGFRANQLEHELCQLAGLEQLETARDRQRDGADASSLSYSSKLPRIATLAPDSAMMVEAPRLLQHASVVRSPDGGALPVSNLYLSVDRLQPALDLVARAASELAGLARLSSSHGSLSPEGKGWVSHIVAAPWYAKGQAASFKPSEFARAAITSFLEVSRGRAILPLPRFAANLDLAIATCIDTLVAAKNEANEATHSKPDAGGTQRASSDAFEQQPAAGLAEQKAQQLPVGPSIAEQSQTRALRQIGRLKDPVSAAPVAKIRRALRQCLVPIGAVAAEAAQMPGPGSPARAQQARSGAAQGGRRRGRASRRRSSVDEASATITVRNAEPQGSTQGSASSGAGGAASEDASTGPNSTQSMQLAPTTSGGGPRDLISPAGVAGHGQAAYFRNLNEHVDGLAKSEDDPGNNGRGHRLRHRRAQSSESRDRGRDDSSGRRSVGSGASASSGRRAGSRERGGRMVGASAFRGSGYHSAVTSGSRADDDPMDPDVASVSAGGLVSVFEWVDAWRGAAARHGFTRASSLLMQLVQGLRCDPSAWVDREQAESVVGQSTREAAVGAGGAPLVAWTAACGFRLGVSPRGVHEPREHESSAATLAPPALRLGGWGMPALMTAPLQQVMDWAAPEPVASATDDGSPGSGSRAAPPPSLCFTWPKPAMVESAAITSGATAAGRSASRWALPAASLLSVELDAAGHPKRRPLDPRVPYMIVGGERTRMVAATPLLAPTRLPPRPEASLRVALPLQALPLPAFRAFAAQDVSSSGSPLSALWLSLALLAAQGGCPGADDEDVFISLQGTVRGGGQLSDERSSDSLVLPGPLLRSKSGKLAGLGRAPGPLAAFTPVYSAALSRASMEEWRRSGDKRLWTAHLFRHASVRRGGQSNEAASNGLHARSGDDLGKGGGGASGAAAATSAAGNGSTTGGTRLRESAAMGLQTSDSADTDSLPRTYSGSRRSGWEPDYAVPGPLHTAWSEAFPALGTLRLLGWPGTTALYSAWVRCLSAHQAAKTASLASTPPAAAAPPGVTTVSCNSLVALDEFGGRDGVRMGGRLAGFSLAGPRASGPGAWTLQQYHFAASDDLAQALWSSACGPVWSDAWSSDAAGRTGRRLHLDRKYPLTMAAHAAVVPHDDVPPTALRKHQDDLVLRLSQTAWLLAAAPGGRAGARGAITLRDTTHKANEGSIAHASSRYHPEQLLASLLMRKLQQYTALGARRARALVFSRVSSSDGSSVPTPEKTARKGARLLQYRLALGDQFTPAALLLATAWELGGAGYDRDTIRPAPLSAAEIVDVLRTDARTKKLAGGPSSADPAEDACGSRADADSSSDTVMDAAADNDRRRYFAGMPTILSMSADSQLDLADECRAKEEGIRGRLVVAASWPARLDADPIEAAYGMAAVPLEGGSSARLAVALPAAATPCLPLDLSQESLHADHCTDLNRIELTHLKVSPHPDATRPNASSIMPPARLFALLASLAPISALFFRWYRAACALYQACAVASHQAARESFESSSAAKYSLTGSVTVDDVAERMAFVLAAVEGRDRKIRVQELTTEQLGGVPATQPLLWAVEALLTPVQPRDAAEMLARIPDHSQGLGSMLLNDEHFQGRDKADLRANVQHESQCAALGRSLWLAGVETEEAVQVLRARITRPD